MRVTKEVAPRFEDYLFDWSYERYLVFGGYGSSKSYHTALKIILKLFQEKRTCLVIRQVAGTIKESCFSLISEILDDMDLLTKERTRDRATKVYQKESPMEFQFPNGSRIIFRGMDNTEKVKSINDISIIWIEECSELSYEGYKELLGRVRTPKLSMHFFLTCNPVDKNNWVYRHFFVRLDDEGHETVLQDDQEVYKKHELFNSETKTYYHHSTVTDNPFVQQEYIDRLDEIKTYDKDLYRIARFGMFGPNGTRVLPQFEVARNAEKFKKEVRAIPRALHFYGFDFGFEESFNAVVSMAVDDRRKILYIYDEIYKNHLTDPQFAEEPKMQSLKKKQQEAIQAGEFINPIVCDNEDPKAISYYRQMGFYVRKCRNKFAGSRLSNTRKVKRFRRIICSPKCINTIRELKWLTYKKDAKGNVIYDEFEIDPHTFSAIWYALDSYTVADPKEYIPNSKAGG